MTHVVPYKPAHYFEVTKNLSPMIGIASDDAAVLYSKQGVAYTGFVNGEIAVCAGVLIPWPGMGEAWAILTNVGRQNPIFVHRAVARGLRDIVASRRLRRVQADVVSEFTVGQQWAARLGFEFESAMLKYGPKGETFVRYRMIP